LLIILGAVKNALAYYDKELITTVKRFIVQAPAVIKAKYRNISYIYIYRLLADKDLIELDYVSVAASLHIRNDQAYSINHCLKVNPKSY